MVPGNDRAAVVSGADVGDAARRRNVPGTPQTVPVPQPQPDDKKAKKVSACFPSLNARHAGAYCIANEPSHCMISDQNCSR